MEYFCRRKPFHEEGKPIRLYRKRMFREWRERRMFESTEQRVCIQARTTRKNGWLSELELEAIKRQIEAESQGELYKERDVRVEAETVETEVRKVEEKMNGAEASMILWKI